MSSNFPGSGLGHAPAYQVASIPFLTSSLVVPDNTSTPMELSFPFVTRSIVVTNTTSQSQPSRPIRFGFSENGILGVENNNYIVLDNGETFESDFRVSRVYLFSDTTFAGSASVVAGLTTIDTKHLLTNWSGSIGVG